MFIKNKLRFLSVLIGFLFIFSCFSFGVAFGDDPPVSGEDNYNVQEAMDKIIAEKQKELDKLSAQYGDALMAQEEMEKQVAEEQAKVAALEEKIKKTEASTNKAIISQYKLYKEQPWFYIFITSDDIFEVFNNLNTLKIIEKHNLNAINQYKEDQEEKEQLLNSLNSKKEEANKKTQEAKEAYDKAQEIINTLKGNSQIAAATAEPYDPAIGSEVVKRAYEEQGKPYVWGAVGPVGYDCSGLVSYCLSGQHKRLGTTTTFMGWPKVTDPKPGDIVTNDHHCAIYIGNGRIIHAPQEGDVVRIASVDWMLREGSIFVRYPG